MGTGNEFVKKIGFFGCAVCVMLFVVFMVFCFSAKAPLEGYHPEHDTEYYSEHIDELKAELEEKLFPRIEGVDSCSEKDGRIIITLSPESFDKSYEIISHYYSLDLVSIERSA